jgi:hypothetical protein
MFISRDVPPSTHSVETQWMLGVTYRWISLRTVLFKVKRLKAKSNLVVSNEYSFSSTPQFSKAVMFLTTLSFLHTLLRSNVKKIRIESQ